MWQDGAKKAEDESREGHEGCEGGIAHQRWV